MDIGINIKAVNYYRNAKGEFEEGDEVWDIFGTLVDCPWPEVPSIGDDIIIADNESTVVGRMWLTDPEESNFVELTCHTGPIDRAPSDFYKWLGDFKKFPGFRLHGAHCEGRSFVGPDYTEQ